MDAQKIVDELKRRYAGKNIIVNPPEKPEEIVCELEPGSINPDRSVAIAVMDKNIIHHQVAKDRATQLSYSCRGAPDIPENLRYLLMM